ncbi:MAG: glutamate 5-kinase [Gammaproteobacteria bacterium]|nr:glutamate 5-kinase [Gammaproteobacteria bacterium]
MADKQRWVIKAGSSLLTDHGRCLDQQYIGKLVDQVAQLRSRGIECVIVSSGAVAAGLSRLGRTERPDTLHELQAAAAIGQMGLIQTYESKFQVHNIHTAQILLTHDDLSNRRRYLNARSTLVTLLSLGVVPIINENDTVVTDEIKFGDNDTLAALVANLVEAQTLVLLTDQDSMYEADPNQNPHAKRIVRAQASDVRLLEMASGGGIGKLGRGGMRTKVLAATRAARSGTNTVIVGGKLDNILCRLADGDDSVGTWIEPDQEPVAARKQWLAGHLQVKGKLVLDDGAVKVLRNGGSSLLPVGVKQSSGSFQRGEVVECTDLNGSRIACGLINYSSDETGKIIGHASKEIEGLLGYVDEPELIHRDNLVLL